MVGLKPCPFCGYKRPYIVVGENDTYWVCCGECYSETSWYNTEEEAREAWNKRV